MIGATMPMAAIAEAMQPQETAEQQAQADATSSDTDKIEETTSSNATDSSDPTSDTQGNSDTPVDATNATDTPTPATPNPQPSLRAQANSTPEAITTAAETGYAHNVTANQNGVTLTLSWDDAAAGEPTRFHLSATGGSGAYKFRMDAPFYMNPGEGYFGEMVADTSRGQWMTWTSSDTGCDYEFTMTASGRYYYRFYLQDAQSSVWSLRVAAEAEVSDDAHPSIDQIITNAVAQCRQETNGSEYDMALWLHDWTLDQLEYDLSLNWCSAESGLTRHQGTCESYQRIYSKLLNAAGIANGRITGNGHTWNAVKIDGKWCQMDLTWDDTSENWYGDLDQRHLYFGLTDELMAIAHSDHAKNYRADSYAYRSTDLSNNYFIRSGKADEWAEAYADRIQQHLDARETIFSIDADNQSFPPSISGIQNGIVAYAMNQRNWETNNAAIALAAASRISTVSSSSWAAAFDFAAEYPEERKEGWSKLDNGLTFYYKDGELVHGEQKIDGKWYYFADGTGEMATGFTTLPYGKKVYYGGDGAMRYGEQKIDGKWYYFADGTGEMATGFTTLPYGKKVYYGGDGAMRYGEQKIDGKWYYFADGTGEMATGFTTLPYGKKVYYGGDGAMRYGEQKIDGIAHYFDLETGEMLY
ncbi:transglutaminase domain-containing protein [Collinsella sp. AM28-11LB]|uniref:transglutaminase domain-containing protein n=1 Tax=Collinsella sp. AM28-11LB TaxID=2292312 RepID=UPI0013145CB2|nr:transglutaminase domain-containing protein [Collinsella sp. AM28-11LB]